MAPIIIKNFGHTYLKYILASCALNNLFIDGAISKDWYKTIAMITPDRIIGISFKNWNIMNCDGKIKLKIVT